MATLENLDDRLQTGEHCAMCPVARAASCPAWRRAAYNAVDVAMRGASEEPDNETLAKELAMYERAAEVMKQAHQFVKDVATARLDSGQTVPGYALERAYGHRYMPDIEAFIKHTLEEADPEQLSYDDFFEKPKPKSPAKLEKLPGINRALTDLFTKRPAKGVRLVEREIEAPPPPVDTPPDKG